MPLDKRFTRTTPLLLSATSSSRTQIPLTKETIDFIKECIEDIWNCGPDTSDVLQPEMLIKWCTYWHHVPVIVADRQGLTDTFVYVKEATFDDILGGKVRIQCQVRMPAASLETNPVELPIVTFIRGT